VLVGRTEGKLYTLCWWAVLIERFIECVVGQNCGIGVYSVLVGVTEGKLYKGCCWAELNEKYIQCVGGQN